MTVGRPKTLTEQRKMKTLTSPSLFKQTSIALVAQSRIDSPRATTRTMRAIDSIAADYCYQDDSNDDLTMCYQDDSNEWCDIEH